jgi:(heptosyl)LPS beta-1,4-glucosyltransferase
MASRLSIVINAQNVEADLPRALASVKDLADEIVVIDQGSTDKTAEIAKNAGAKVFEHESVRYVELTRNFAISKATGDWVLLLDPDEEIPPTLAKKIKEVIKSDKVDYYRIPRKNIIFGKWIEHTLWWPDYQTRLFKKGKVSWNEVIHSVPLTLGNGQDFEPKEVLAILHHNYDFVEQYLDKLNRYTSVQAGLLVKRNYKFDWRDIISKPCKEFTNRYFTGEGYKDGLHGLALSLLQSFSELVLYLKTWQAEKFKEKEVGVPEVIEEMSTREKDLHFWQNDVLYKETGSFGARIKRKLRI